MGEIKGVPNVENYMIGKGVVSIAKFDPVSGVVAAYADVGNCTKFEYEMTEQTIEHFSSRSGMKEQDQETVIQAGYNLSFTLDEVAVENLRMFMKASLSGVRTLYANQNINQKYAVKFVADNPVGPNVRYEFWKCKLTPNGAFSLISDEYTSMSFSGKGLSDRLTVAHATSPWFTATFDTSTTTTTTTAP
jgi:hypothetical protein